MVAQEHVMASDLVVALGEAAVNRQTLFGANHYARSHQRQHIRLTAGGSHPPDEHLRVAYLRLPQARQTYTVLGQQPEGSWGFVHGINENQVAIGVSRWYSRLPAVGGGLTGSDLTRLALERSHSAMQALDVLTDLISRHGQCPEAGSQTPADNLFLVADGQEAFVVEAAGRYWAILECRQVRAVTDVALIRQDWQRLSPGLSSLAIENGWWDGDGSKLDFAGCLDAHGPTHAAARRRWGRATLALEQQNGAIEGSFLRRMLLDHHDTSDSARTHRPPAPLAGSFMAGLQGANQPVVAWCAFGLPRSAVYFPAWLDGDLPEALGGAAPDGTDIWQQTRDLAMLGDDSVRESLERLQTVFEQDVDALLPQARQWKRDGDHVRLRHETTALMHNHVGLLAREWRAVNGLAEPETVPPAHVDDFVSFIS
jgi:secernin